MNKSLAILGALGLAACGWFGNSSNLSTAQAAPTATPAGEAPQVFEGLVMEPVSYAPLVEALAPAVVNVDVQGTAEVASPELMIPEEFRRFFSIPEIPPEGRSRKTYGSGSGFVISADGYVLTNNHVVDGAETIAVTFTDERKFDAELIGVDERIDVALLKIEADGPLPYLKLGASEEARVGDRVIAIGNPFGLGHTVTTGILSGKGRALGAGPYDDFLQTDAAINPGNSGGPLFNLAGEVIGINTAIIAQANNIGFTIPSEMVLDVLDDLKREGRVAHGWLGVGIQTLTPELAEAMEIDAVDGVVITDVHPGGPAAEAGLKSGDIVLSLAGEPVDETGELIRAVGEQRAGDEVAIEVLRRGRHKTLEVTLGERPSEQALAQGRWDDGPEGPGGEDLMDALGLSLEETAEGVVIAAVDPDSAAAELLQEGDIVLEVDRRRARSAAEVASQLGGRKGVHLLVIKRQGRRIFVPLQVS